jgi:hypothetical protein
MPGRNPNMTCDNNGLVVSDLSIRRQRFGQVISVELNLKGKGDVMRYYRQARADATFSYRIGIFLDKSTLKQKP